MQGADQPKEPVWGLGCRCIYKPKGLADLNKMLKIRQKGIYGWIGSTESDNMYIHIYGDIHLTIKGAAADSPGLSFKRKNQRKIMSKKPCSYFTSSGGPNAMYVYIHIFCCYFIYHNPTGPCVTFSV